MKKYLGVFVGQHKVHYRLLHLFFGALRLQVEVFDVLDYEESRKKTGKVAIEDKRAAIKQLIERIPTEKSELFAWPMDWNQVDQVNRRHRPRTYYLFVL